MSAITMTTGSTATSNTGKVTIPVTVVARSGDVDQPYALQFPEGMLYLRMSFEYQNVIEWTLVKSEAVRDALVQFDHPGITFLENPAALTPSYADDRMTLQVPWTNLDEGIRPFGHSFAYRLHVVVTRDAVSIPVSHDPVVHNEPPIP